MRRVRYFESYKALPRMAWNPRNLYNLWSRSVGPHATGKYPLNPTRFKGSSQSLFKQRWQSKKLVRAYHCDYIPEKKFIRWYLPERLPDPMAANKKNTAAEAAPMWARQEAGKKDAGGVQLAPISSLMFAELERRIDVVVFRSCFAHSIHAARQLVVHGKVTLNGIKENDPNTRLNPGDMISVNPDAMTLLHPPKGYESPKSEEAIGEEAKVEPATAEAEAEKPTEDLQSAKSTEEGSADTAKPTKSPANKKKSSKKQDKSKDPTIFDANPGEPAFRLPPYAAPFIFIPSYLEVSFATCSSVYVRHPTARPNYSEIATPFDADGEIVRFAWEWYVQNRTRIRNGWKRAVRERMEKGKSGWSGVERPLQSP